MRLRAKASTILSLLLATSSVAWGQYVQIPSTPGGFPAQPSYVTPAPGTFTAPSLNPAPSLGPPPAFDAYASPSVSGTMGAPPASVPYGMTPSAPATAFPQQPGAWQGYPTTPGGYGAPMPQSTSPSSLPYQWQQGSYSYQGADGSLVKFQKFLQRIGVENTWLADVGGADAFGMNRLELAATFGIPVMHNIETPLLLTPGFAFNWLDGPQGDPNAIPRGPDLPPRVYDAYLDLSWYPQPFEWFGAELGVRTGVWTDFEAVNSDSVRILGRGVGVISVNPHMDFLIGVAYLDRLHIKLLPVVGVHWRPSTEWDLYIVFPNPKLRKRMRSMGNTDWWWYVAGEYGGGSWTVDRVGLSDRFDYNDIRVSLGVEYESPTMARGHFEVGYVFDREILFNSGQPGRFDPADTVMVRAGFDF